MGNNINKRPLSAREGKIYIDGELIAEACKFQLKFTPTVWSGKTLSEQGTNRRWTGYDITGTLEQWKSTKLARNKINEYIRTGATPEFKIQGICDDKNSDYYEAYGKDEAVAVGCVFTGDMNLMDLDTDGDVVKESLAFGAKDLV